MNNLYGQDNMKEVTTDLKGKLQDLIKKYEDDTAPEIS